MPNPILAFFQSIGMPELIVVGIIALLIFGRRLPEVGRSLGRGIVEFKKGLRDTEDEVKQIASDVDISRADKSASNSQPAQTVEKKRNDSNN